MNYTTIEQSIRLEKLGLDIMTADMFYNEEPDENYPKDIVDTKYPMVIREGQKHRLLEYGIPCWSLDALFKLMPKIGATTPIIVKALLEEKYYCHYHGIGTFKEVNTTTFHDEPIDAAYEMIIYLIENGYIKTKS